MADDIHIIPFVKSSGLIMIEAELDGESGFFIFDSCADALVINDSDFKDEVDFKFQSLNGVFKSEKVEITNLKFGTYKFFNLNGFKADLSHLEVLTSRHILGIVSAKMFETEVLRVDNIKKTIELYPKKYMKHLDGKDHLSCPIYFENNVPILEVTINGEKYPFALDTGASASLIDQSFVKSNRPLFTNQNTSINLLTAHKKGSKASVSNIKSFKIANARIEKLSFAQFDFSEVNKLFSKDL
ncbi:MAG: hypothetical protein HKO66_13220, partial [Saprospiraceae bacterium]|nr:retropepsin-like domain-containing protein [Bacteroidia bacterium]NNE16625.1 hypothetical protein [Saprospiraceae bacterium]NNL93194.1 hypothetical protein [Saprospiraceae bacterium]